MARTLFAGVLGLAVLVPVTGHALADIPQERKAELLYLLEQDCGSCHGLTMKGGLGSPLRPEILAERSDEQLVEIILDGVPDTPMPPWRPLMSEEEAAFLVQVLRKDGMKK